MTPLWQLVRGIAEFLLRSCIAGIGLAAATLIFDNNVIVFVCAQVQMIKDLRLRETRQRRKSIKDAEAVVMADELKNQAEDLEVRAANVACSVRARVPSDEASQTADVRPRVPAALADGVSGFVRPTSCCARVVFDDPCWHTRGARRMRVAQQDN